MDCYFGIQGVLFKQESSAINAHLFSLQQTFSPNFFGLSIPCLASFLLNFLNSVQTHRYSCLSLHIETVAYYYSYLSLHIDTTPTITVVYPYT